MCCSSRALTERVGTGREACGNVSKKLFYFYKTFRIGTIVGLDKLSIFPYFLN